MPHDPLTQLRRNTVKTPLTPQTPGEWLLTKYDSQATTCAYPGLYDADGNPAVTIQPMFTLKSDTEATDPMQVTSADYADRYWRPL